MTKTETDEVSLLRSLGVKPGEALTRTISFERASGDDVVDRDRKTIWFIASTDKPVPRWGDLEVLVHTKKAIRFDRLESGNFSFLEDHRWSQFRGGVDEWKLVEEKGASRLSIKVRFSTRPEAQCLFDEYADGLRASVSIGYFIHAVELASEREGVATYHVTDWEPIELSAVTVPADLASGVGRSVGDDQSEISGDSYMKNAGKGAGTPGAEGQDQETVQRSVKEAFGDADADKKPAEARSTDKPDGQFGIEAFGENLAELKRETEILNIVDIVGCSELGRKAIQEGMPVAEFRKLAADFHKARKAKVPTESTRGDLGMSLRERERYSIGKALRACLTKDWSKAGLEREVSDSLLKMREKNGGIARQGSSGSFLVNYEALSFAGRNALSQRAGLDVAAGIGGEFVLTDLDNSIIHLLRDHSILGDLGLRILTGLIGNLDLPRQTGGANFEWLPHGGTPTDSGLTFDLIHMTPKLLAGAVPYTQQMAMQSSVAVDALIIDDMMGGIAEKLDYSGLWGSGTNDEILGLLMATGVGAVDASLGHTWATTVGLETEIRTAKVRGKDLAYIVPPALVDTFKTTEKFAGSGREIMPEGGKLNGYRAEDGGGLIDPGKLALGKWSEGILGVWGSMEIDIDDTTNRASRGKVIRVWEACDMANRRPAAFAVAA